MRTEVKKAWIEALRSGDYVQGRGQLASLVLYKGGRRYCCLGVLCEISPIDETDPSETGTSHEMWCGMHGLPPRAVMDWAGMRGVDLPDLYDRDGRPVELAMLNDESRLSFDQIADLIDYFYEAD